ncbi:MAG TPA: 50S ribosomal protein L10 [Candidatus Paceibacterota bacterium]|nr:50S ribosomal protein L10 [Candidatus Paceibacterota bacterium]
MLTRAQKEKILNDLVDKINKNPAVLMVDFTGLKVSDLSNLRKELKNNEMELKVVKKTLVQKMLSHIGINFNIFTFPGSIALIFSPEEGLIASKTVYKFNSEKKEPKLKILGGFINKNFFSVERIIELAKLPSKEVLLSQLVYTLNSLPRTLVGVLNGNIQKLVIALDAIAKKQS